MSRIKFVQVLLASVFMSASATADGGAAGNGVSGDGPKPAAPRRIESTAQIGHVPGYLVRYLSINPGDGFEPRGNCPQVVRTHSSANFAGGSFVLQQGFAESEMAAAQFTVPADDFPIRLDLAEMIFAQQSTVATETHWSILVWSGPPSTGTLLAQHSSDDVILPHLRMPPGTQGTNIQFSIDPEDPEQLIIEDSGDHTFTVAYRIDQHNDQTQDPCFVAPPANRNAFPTTDTNGLGQGASNWLFGVDCGPFGCPANGGWSRFSQLPSYCRPSGDWNIRATYTSVICNSEPVVTEILPNNGLNTSIRNATVNGGNFDPTPLATDVRLTPTNQANQLDIVGVINTITVNSINADFELTGVATGAYDVRVTTPGGFAVLANGFTVNAPQPPTVTGFTPTTSPNNTSISATVTGTQFIDGAMSVELVLGATVRAATNITVISPTQLTCMFDLRCAPAGNYGCRANNGVGTSPTRLNSCSVTTLAAPTFGLRTPATATNCPGNFQLRVDGTNFQNGATVALTRPSTSFADVPAGSVTFNSATRLTANFDLSGVDTGTWRVRVTNPDCRTVVSPDTAAGRLTISTCVPTISSIAPNSATNHESDVMITDLLGTNFVAGANVLLRRGGADITATEVVVHLGNSRISCRLNPYLAQVGDWDVLVINPGGGTGTQPAGFTINAGPPPGVIGVIDGNGSDVVENCGQVEVTIFGDSFLEGPTAKLVLPGEPEIDANAVVRLSDSQLVAAFDLTNAQTTIDPERWDIVVQNPDNQSGIGIDLLGVTACTSSCVKGDMNLDGLHDDDDVNVFVSVLVSQGGSSEEFCAADLAMPFGVIDQADLDLFAACMLDEGNCP